MLNSRFPVLALMVFISLTSVNWTPQEAGIRPSDPKALTQHGTTVVPVPTEALPPGKNVLWCSTFQMAWDAAAAKFGRPLRLVPASKLADSLNRSPFDRRWVDETSVFTAEGLIKEDVLGRIDQGMLDLTGMKSVLTDQLKNTASPDDLVFFASLKKDLEFPQPFGKLGAWKLGVRKVPWFGFTPEQKETGLLRGQVRVHHYGAKDDFVIELLSKDTAEQIILAKLPAAPGTPAEASRNMLKHLRPNAPQAGEADLLAVPNIVVEESATFTQLEGRKVAGTGMILRKALQTIDFRMDEKGVKLKSEAALSFGCSAQIPVIPRLMILDPPFALVMKHKNAPQAYFVAWFANAGLLGGD